MIICKQTILTPDTMPVYLNTCHVITEMWRDIAGRLEPDRVTLVTFAVAAWPIHYQEDNTDRVFVGVMAEVTT